MDFHAFSAVSGVGLTARSPNGSVLTKEGMAYTWAKENQELELWFAPDDDGKVLVVVPPKGK